MGLFHYAGRTVPDIRTPLPGPAAQGLLGRDAPHCTTNFPMSDYADAAVPDLVGKSREDVKAALKSERAKAPRRRFWACASRATCRGCMHTC